MKRLLVTLCIVGAIFTFAGCGSDSNNDADKTVSVEATTEDNKENDKRLTFVEGKIMELPFNDETLDCVCIITDYTNTTGETVMPADDVNVTAFQNGVELSPWVFTGEETEGCIQCDTKVQDGTAAKVIWIFERQDDSEVSVEFSDGQKFTVK